MDLLIIIVYLYLLILWIQSKYELDLDVQTEEVKNLAGLSFRILYGLKNPIEIKYLEDEVSQSKYIGEIAENIVLLKSLEILFFLVKLGYGAKAISSGHDKTSLSRYYIVTFTVNILYCV